MQGLKIDAAAVMSLLLFKGEMPRRLVFADSSTASKPRHQLGVSHPRPVSQVSGMPRI